MRIRDTPIRRKLITMIFGTSLVVLSLTCASFIGYEWFTYRQAAMRDLSTLGEVIAAQSTGAVAFDNVRDATEVLAALQVERHVTAAALYDKQGTLFARYPAVAAPAEFPVTPGRIGCRFDGGGIVSFTPLVQVRGSDPLGTLYLRSDLGPMKQRFRLYVVVTTLVMLLSSVVAWLLSRRLQRHLSDPIIELADAATAVSLRRDYSVRATKHGEDELGVLTEAFNHMLAEIEQQNAQLEQRVRERTAELEAANDELEAFCSSAAHDLRTPLRAITGFTDVLLDDRATGLPPSVKRYVGAIRTGSEQMSQLIEDLLSFSRVGRQDLKRQLIDPTTLCHEVLLVLEPESKGRTLELELGSLPHVYADPALLRLVFANLLGNALKYTRGRSPARIAVGALPGGLEETTLFVKDNGVGFDMEHASKLFGVFQRLHLSHEFEGTGVGLATVRRIIERHGGRVWAQAAPDVGATFFFSLPAPPRNGDTAPQA